MSRRSLLPPFWGVLLASCFHAALLLGGEPDPWAPGPRHGRERMEELADAEARGETGPEERLELRAYWANHLRRGEVNALESARYSAAELHLQLGDPKAAIAELTKVLAEAQNQVVSDLTHFNLAEVHRRRLNDTDSAVKHYRLVGGDLSDRARRFMVAMLAERGKPDEAAKLLEADIAAAKEKGEKLVLLHRLAALYCGSNLLENALAIYQRITKEFTPDDLKQMREAAAKEASAAIDQMIAFRDQGRGDEMERFQRRLDRRARQLRGAGRWDEFRAFMQAMQQGHQRLRQHEEQLELRERERDRREEQREREEERREREGGEGEPRREGQF